MLQLVADSKFSFFWRNDPPHWILSEGGLGQKHIPMHVTPFVIGRAYDCQLVLPNSRELAFTTSRWHCFISEAAGRHVVTDGSLHATPETGLVKPSVVGTFINGRKLDAPSELRAGDVLKVGPWTFTVEVATPQKVDIDKLLTQVAAAAPVELWPGDSRQGPGFSQFQVLYDRLNQTFDADESLSIILSFAISKIKAAEVAAILLFQNDEVVARMAWQRNSGRLFGFKFSSGLVTQVPPNKAFLLRAAIQDGTKSQVEQKINSGLLVPLRGSQERLGLLYMDNRQKGGSFSEEDLYFASSLASVASMQLSLEKQLYLGRLESNMRQYFSPDAARLIMEESRQGRPVNLGVKETQATIMFIDMVGFSEFSRTHTPQEVSELLNPYFGLAADAIQKNGGHVDKFIGDGVMGVFGAHPFQAASAPGDHCLQAVRAAHAVISEWSKRTIPRWKGHIPLRIGISTGKVVIGNIGFPGRMEYSVLGDTVNFAARLEKCAEPDGIALGDAAYQAVHGEFPAAIASELEIKGIGVQKIWRLGSGVKPS